MRNISLERARASQVDPVAIPFLGHGPKDNVLSIRVNSHVMEYIKGELAKLGIENARDCQDFYRGAIVASIANARRAKSPSWKKFVEAIQPTARKHLGMGLDLDGTKEIMDADGLK